MKNFLKSLLIGLVLACTVPLTVHAQTIVFPPQGGTGIGTATTTNIGQCLTVSSSAPFRYKFAPCGSGGGGDQNWTINGGGVLVPTSTIDVALPAALSVTGGFTFSMASGTSITSTNAFFTGLRFTNALGTSITTTNGSFTNLNVGSDTVTDITGTNLEVVGGALRVVSNPTFTSITSTNAFFTNLGFGSANGTSITSTNGNIGTLTFTTAVGTSVTTTNLAVTGALSLPTNSVTNAMIASSSAWVVKSLNGLDFASTTLTFKNLAPSSNEGDMMVYKNGIWNRVPASANTSSLRFLSQVGTSIPTWQSVPTLGAYTYFMLNSSSTSGSYKNLGVATTTITQKSFGAITGATLVTQWITATGTPSLTTIPAGIWLLHSTATKDGGIKDLQFYFEVYKYSLGSETLLFTTANSQIITGTDTSNPEEIDLEVSTSTISLGVTDRIVVKQYATESGIGLDASGSIYYGGTTESRIQLPAAIVDTTNFVPYTGATAGLNMGLFSITSTNLFASGLGFTAANGTSITSTNAFFTRLSFTSATGTSVSSTNLYLGGAFSQSAFSDCSNAVTAKVLYTQSTGLFSCGTDQTGGGGLTVPNTLLVFGAADNTATTSANISFVTTTNLFQVIGTVSSTNLLSINATTTNFKFTTGVGTTLTLTSGTSTNFFSTGLTFTNLSGTNATTTNLRASGLTNLAGTTITNGTSTNFFSTLLQFTNLNGTNATTTNLSVTTNLSLPANSISNAFFRQSAGLSVVGRSANTTGNVADITGTDGQVLRVNGTTLGFGAITLSNAISVTGTLPTTMGGTGVTSSMPQSIDRVYTVSTTSFTWTKPLSSRFQRIKVTIVGPGGGGGGTDTTSTKAGGGCGGGFAYGEITSSTLASTSSISISVGAAGAGGAINVAGSAGGSSSFSVYLTATGGNGGPNGTVTDAGCTTVGVGSVSTTLVTNFVTSSGMRAASAGPLADTYRGWGGSACAGWNKPNGDGAGFVFEDANSSQVVATIGGFLGQWCGIGGVPPATYISAGAPGGRGGLYGGGGGGAAKYSSGLGQVGGIGGRSVVVVTEEYE